MTIYYRKEKYTSLYSALMVHGYVHTVFEAPGFSELGFGLQEPGTFPRDAPGRRYLHTHYVLLCGCRLLAEDHVAAWLWGKRPSVQPQKEILAEIGVNVHFLATIRSQRSQPRSGSFHRRLPARAFPPVWRDPSPKAKRLSTRSSGIVCPSPRTSGVARLRRVGAAKDQLLSFSSPSQTWRLWDGGDGQREKDVTTQPPRVGLRLCLVRSGPPPPSETSFALFPCSS